MYIYTYTYTYTYTYIYIYIHIHIYIYIYYILLFTFTGGDGGFCIFIVVISCGEVISVYIQKSLVIVSIHSYVFDRKTKVDKYLFYCIEKLCVLTWIRKYTHRRKVT